MRLGGFFALVLWGWINTCYATRVGAYCRLLATTLLTASYRCVKDFVKTSAFVKIKTTRLIKICHGGGARWLRQRDSATLSVSGVSLFRGFGAHPNARIKTIAFSST